MKQTLYFLIGFSLVLISYGLLHAECGKMTGSYPGYDYLGHYATADLASDALGTEGYHYPHTLTCENGLTISVHRHEDYGVDGQVLYRSVYSLYTCCNATCKQDRKYFYATFGDITPCPPDSDGDGISDGLDAYPDTDSAYQFRIMTNYFDADGNCVGQLIVTSSGDYVLLGDLTAAEIEAGVSAGTYKSDFVNSPIWIDSSDLEDDSASDIYASGDSTTAVNSTTASGLTSSATTADANDLSTADGVTAGSTYDSGSDTDSSSLGKIVDNTAAVTSNQQALANYAKKQSELQATGNALLGQINDTLKNQSDSGSDSFDFDEQGAETAKSEFNNLSVSNYYSADDYNGTLTPETDYDEAQDLEDVSWFTDFFSNNPLKTAFNSSGFELSSGACEVSYTIDGWGTYSISLCEFSSAFETAGNLLFSLTSLLSLIIIAWR